MTRARRRGVASVVLLGLLFVVPVVGSLAAFMATVANASTWDSGRWTPTPPEGLQVTGVDDNAPTLSWRPVTSPVAAADYQLSYRPAGGSFVEQPFTAETSATVTGLAPDSEYEFRVRSRSGASSPSDPTYTSDWSPLLDASTHLPPDVAVTAPAQDAFVRGTTGLAARATDAGGVAEVVFRVDGVEIGRDGAEPFTVQFDTRSRPDGPVTVTAEATDLAGNTATSAPTRVVLDNTAPTATVRVEPDDPVRLVGTVRLTADASDAASGVESVSYRGNAPCPSQIGTATSSPFGVFWDTAACPDGPVSVAATVRDRAGNTAVVTSRTYQIDNVGPTVGVTSPAAGSTVTGTTTLRANAQDAGSSVSRVEFRVDGATVGTVTTAPFELTWNSTSVPDGSHQVTATATSASGRQAVSPPVTFTVHNAPAAPTGVTATSGQNRQVPVTWNASARAVSYRVEYRVAGTSGAFTTTTTASTSTVITGLINGTTYEFRVVALDARGQPSPPSATVTATPRRSTAPSTPTGLTATGGERQVSTAWNAVNDPELAGYRLRHRVAGTTGPFTEVDVTETSRVVTGLADGTSYEFAVAARDTSGNLSAWSSTVTALTISATPQNFTAVRRADTGVGARQVDASWSASQGAAGYELQYRLVGAATWTSQTTTATSLRVSNLQANREYEFRVRSGNASGASAFSPVVVVRTL